MSGTYHISDMIKDSTVHLSDLITFLCYVKERWNVSLLLSLYSLFRAFMENTAEAIYVISMLVC